MSVITEISMFPIGNEIHLSKYVAKIISMFRENNIKHELTAMGTIYETDNLDDALKIIQLAYSVLEADSERVYCTAKFDINRSKTNALNGKVKSVIEKL